MTKSIYIKQEAPRLVLANLEDEIGATEIITEDNEIARYIDDVVVASDPELVKRHVEKLKKDGDSVAWLIDLNIGGSMTKSLNLLNHVKSNYPLDPVIIFSAHLDDEAYVDKLNAIKLVHWKLVSKDSESMSAEAALKMMADVFSKVVDRGTEYFEILETYVSQVASMKEKTNQVEMEIISGPRTGQRYQSYLDIVENAAGGEVDLDDTFFVDVLKKAFSVEVCYRRMPRLLNLFTGEVVGSEQDFGSFDRFRDMTLYGAKPNKD